jgi:hypothetical protein
VAAPGNASARSSGAAHPACIGSIARRALPWIVLLGALIAAVIDGLTAVHGMARPPDQDSLRDLGNMQAILDGNWFGDPVYPGELRWYPPLIPLFGAAAGWLVEGDLAAIWLAAGPWLNLGVMALFFLMARRLFDTETAAAATLVYLLVDSHIGRPWVSGGYTPWPLAPSLTTGLFFAAIWLIHRHGGAGRWSGAAAIGTALGVVALAHTVPGLILAVIVTSVAVTTQGLRVRTILWLALVAIIQIALLLPYILPLWLRYGLRILNPVPGGYVTDVLRPEYAWFTASFAAAVMATVVAAVLLRRSMPMAPATIAIMGAWLGCSAAMLGRHYACRGLAEDIPACQFFVVAVHHWSLYLTLGWTVVAGWVTVAAARIMTSGIRNARGRGTAVAAMALATGAAATVAYLVFAIGDPTAETRDPTADVRNWAMADDGRETDWEAYRWILANSASGDVFVTDGSEPAAFSVIPAGRALIAAPKQHSNPYVLWAPRERERRDRLAAATGSTNLTAFCDGRSLFLLVPRAMPIRTAGLMRVFESRFNAIYHPVSSDCAPISDHPS